MARVRRTYAWMMAVVPVAVMMTMVMLTDVARAQAPAPVASVDWTGYYTLARGAELQGLTPVGLNWHALIVDHLQPWAKMKMEATDGVADDTGAVCKPDGIFRFPTNAGSFLWLPTPDKVVIVWQDINTAGTQRVYLNRQHPRNLRPTWSGDSIGRWEGDTLVVDTIGFNDKSWLSPAMEPHTEEAHLIQRIRSVRDGAFIEIVNTVEDRQALTSAYTYSRYYRRAGESMRENVCNEDPQLWTEIRMKRLQPLLDRAREVRK